MVTRTRVVAPPTTPSALFVEDEEFAVKPEMDEMLAAGWHVEQARFLAAAHSALLDTEKVPSRFK